MLNDAGFKKQESYGRGLKNMSQQLLDKQFLFTIDLFTSDNNQE